MPQFYPEHTPADVDDFTKGYLACMEWLLPEETDSDGSIVGPPPYDRMRGFNRETLRRVKRDCREFVKANAELLHQYEESTGRDMESAGNDFFLTRNRHGAGFWDRGSHPCLKTLTEAAEGFGSTYEYLNRSGYLISARG